MNNIVSYVQKTMEPFKDRPFCEVDSLVLSQVSYLHLDGMVPDLNGTEPVLMKELLKAEHLPAMLRGIWAQDSNHDLLFALAASPRFRDVKLLYFVDDVDSSMAKQFSAVTFFLEDGTSYLAYRGTDATIVGWKEDFNMAFMGTIPSQLAAAEYANSVAKRLSGPLRIGGHSKGGNLAVYAAVMCDPAVQNRLVSIHSHDGPGFQIGTFDADSYAAVQALIHKTLPQSSLFGMLLEHQEPYEIVESSRKGGIMQHDPFSWTVDGTDFHYLEKLSGSALSMSHTLNSWLTSLSYERREAFVDTLFQVVEASGATTFAELRAAWQKNLPVLLSAAKNIDSETRGYVFDTIKSLVLAPLKFRRRT